MEEFVAYIVKNLVAEPGEVQVFSSPEEDGIKIEIKVAPNDVGKIVGRRGNTIHALRTIVRRISSRVKKKVQLELIQTYADESPDLSSEDCMETPNHAPASSCCHSGISCCMNRRQDIESDLQESSDFIEEKELENA
ncbi:Uncharacterized protein CLAVI_000099 [Candidatus Clavichlamydia salmonicola]|uniref:KH domain-containing protein n=1 Tax=Candidatus Clavichlamydia salmonicola TaxID=469812 RepID=UPI0018916A54|nr:KH domain-containing protein [Candidatus Clavichlamydia salmonicola]MBF5050494.1 Uncharacterized protein [Candidatus Clavichlamydia salmonicola]